MISTQMPSSSACSSKTAHWSSAAALTTPMTTGLTRRPSRRPRTRPSRRRRGRRSVLRRGWRRRGCGPYGWSETWVVLPGGAQVCAHRGAAAAASVCCEVWGRVVTGAGPGSCVVAVVRRRGAGRRHAEGVDRESGACVSHGWSPGSSPVRVGRQVSDSTHRASTTSRRYDSTSSGGAVRRPG